MVRIKVRHGESLEQALRRFNRKVTQAKIIRETLDRSRHTKKSEKERQRKKAKERKVYLENKYRQ